MIYVILFYENISYFTSKNLKQVMITLKLVRNRFSVILENLLSISFYTMIFLFALTLVSALIFMAVIVFKGVAESISVIF